MAIDDFTDVLGLYIDLHHTPGSPPRLFNLNCVQIERQGDHKQNEYK